MKVWEWIRELSKHPAGAEVYFSLDYLAGQCSDGSIEQTPLFQCDEKIEPDPISNCINVAFQVDSSNSKDMASLLSCIHPERT